MNKFLKYALKYYTVFMGAGFILILVAFLIMMKYREVGIIPVATWFLAGVGVTFYILGRVLFFVNERNRKIKHDES